MCIYICIYHQKKSERSEFWSNLLRNKLVLEGFPNPKPWLQRGSSAFFHPSSHCRHLLEVRTMLFVLLKLSLAPKNQHGTWDVYEMEHIHLHGLVSLWLCILQIGKDSIKVPMLKVTSMLPRLPPCFKATSKADRRFDCSTPASWQVGIPLNIYHLTEPFDMPSWHPSHSNHIEISPTAKLRTRNAANVFMSRL